MILSYSAVLSPQLIHFSSLLTRVFHACFTGEQCEGLLAFGFYARAVWQWRQKVRKHLTNTYTHSVKMFYMHRYTQPLICLSLSQVGGGSGHNPWYVCYRVGWVLLRSVHVQLQPRSPVYPLHLHCWQLFPVGFNDDWYMYKQTEANINQEWNSTIDKK